jgi:predicted Rossmann-fold nucleotide-binding protein
VVLMGVRYWTGLLDWVRETMAGEGKISPADLDLICLTDDVAEAVRYIVEADVALASEHEAAAKAAAERLAAEGGGSE